MTDDGSKVAPHVYKVVSENERGRVLEVTLEPGARAEMHSHPGYFIYFLSSGKGRFTAPSGESEEIEWPDGAVMWRDAEEHATENIGGTTVRALFFEPK